MLVKANLDLEILEWDGSVQNVYQLELNLCLCSNDEYQNFTNIIIIIITDESRGLNPYIVVINWFDIK